MNSNQRIRKDLYNILVVNKVNYTFDFILLNVINRKHIKLSVSMMIVTKIKSNLILVYLINKIKIFRTIFSENWFLLKLAIFEYGEIYHMV